MGSAPGRGPLNDRRPGACGGSESGVDTGSGHLTFAAKEHEHASRKELATMLVLMRRVGEKLVIGEDVTVTILGIKGTQVRVGIAAPKEVPVHREEVYERIQSERAAARVRSRQTHGDSG